MAEKGVGKYGWVLLVLVSIVLIINGLFYLLTGAETDTHLFQHLTGLPWNTFTATGGGTVGMVTYVAVDLRILGLVIIITGLQSAVIAYTAFRKRERWAFYTLILVPLGLLYALGLDYDGGGSTWPIYLILLVIDVVGLLLPVRKFFPKKAAPGLPRN